MLASDPFSTDSLSVPGLALAIALLAGPPAAAQQPAQITTETVASGLGGLLFVTHVPGDSDRLFTVQQSGTIRVLVDDVLQPTPFLNLASKVSTTANERGLLGLAFPPDHASTGLFYVSYTRVPDGASVIERYNVGTNPNVADPASGQIVFGPVSQPFSNHNGGCIQFGPDGFLYYALGDGGSSGDPACRAQNGQTLLGKLLRLDVSTTPASAPATNPFVGVSGFRDEIWAYGLRNPWRFAFDPVDGDLYIGDVGQNAREEIDWVPGTSTGGENYGWKMMEGTFCFSTSACPAGTPPCNAASLTDPVHDYSSSFSVNECSVTGGVVYQGLAVPSLQGKYFFGDYCTGKIWSMRVQGGVVSDFVQETGVTQNFGLTSFGQDADGEIYICRQNGNLLRVVSSLTQPVDLGLGKPGGNGEIPQLSFVGLLAPGESSELRVDDAAPGAPAAMLLAPNQPPTTTIFGDLIPFPPTFVFPFSTDANGSFTLPLVGSPGPSSAAVQCVFLDPGAALGVSSSNALQIFSF